MMNVISTDIDEVLIFEPEKVFFDDRGYLFESFRDDFFKKKLNSIRFIQENQSQSTYGVLRGLHFQQSPYAQSKLIRVIKGKIQDIAVDLRPNSKTFKKFITIKFESRNNLLYIPKGIAHGFLSLSDNTIINYKCDSLYNPNYESGLNPFKSNLNIDWGIDENDIIMSNKDRCLPSLEDSYIY
ncbi:uncharacterized protein METZ01_LOCUS472670 [marine metagenome]|uniref:dTDP-4-dehydrorhamnose 3,5-epimerase n=1 Tax=marine metagenome TaxID=408172 RepID=A0A383BHZ3_9ZZZZ